MIVIATIGATMTMPIAPRLPVLTATAAEQPMTSKKTSEPTINHAADEAGAAGAATTRSVSTTAPLPERAACTVPAAGPHHASRSVSALYEGVPADPR